MNMLKRLFQWAGSDWRLAVLLIAATWFTFWISHRSQSFLSMLEYEYRCRRELIVQRDPPAPQHAAILERSQQDLISENQGR